MFHIFSWPLFAMATPFVASAFGLFELDLSFSGFEAMVRAQVAQLGAATTRLSMGLYQIGTRVE